MNRSRKTRYLICFILLFATLGGMLGGSAAFAADGDQPEETIKFNSKFPTVEGIASDVFEFEVFIQPTSKDYIGKYDFTVVAPPGWDAGVWGSYPEKRVSSIDFTGEQVHSETINVKAFAEAGEQPEPGDYDFTLTMVWEEGDIESTLDLTAVVTASYGFNMVTQSGRLSAQTDAGEDNPITIMLVNTGTATIDDVTLSAEAPEEWGVIFDPAEVDALEPGVERTVDVIVTPPEKTIAGDYLLIINADSEKGTDDMEMRITVLASTLWGWAGIGIAAGVVTGLIILFRRLGRR